MQGDAGGQLSGRGGRPRRHPLDRQAALVRNPPRSGRMSCSCGGAHARHSCQTVNREPLLQSLRSKPKHISTQNSPHRYA